MKLIVFALLLPLTARAATLRVGQPGTECTHAGFSTIVSAIMAAAPDDLIEICPAKYSEQLLIAKPLTL